MSDTSTAAPDTGNNTADPAATTDATTTDASTADSSQDQPDTGSQDLAAEVEKWKSMARKHEERAKEGANAKKELAELRKTAMSDKEREVAEAVEAAEARIISQYGSRLADAQLRAAAKDLPVDLDALLEGVDPGKFLDEAGEPDQAAIAAWVQKLTPEPADPSTGMFDLGQGVRTTGNTALAGDPLERDLKAKLGIR